mmetsp:Transcript_17041/g.31970  ORF Transcript_17041/g.31970 Transcript_17041/m.31970 type:complete len:210 (+) Transcript_17041:565-1194(+)
MRFFAMLRISTAALLSFISSTNAVCSVLRCAVASATLSSRDLMPASSAAISSTRLAFFSSISSIAFWRPEAVSSKDAALSEASSRLALQSATFVSSAVCSSLRRATMSSIIFKTLPKSAFFAMQGQRDEIEAMVVPAPLAFQHGVRLPQELLRRHLQLQQRRARQRLLEQFQCIVVVQKFDGVCQCDRLFAKDLLLFCVFGGPGLASGF